MTEASKRLRTTIIQGDLEGVATLVTNDPELRDVITPFGTWLHIAAGSGLPSHREMACRKWHRH